jgi:hypothetical protein
MNMKIQKYFRLLMVISIIALSISSCTKGFEEMNRPYNSPSSASVNDLFNTVVSSMQPSWQRQATYHSFVYEITQQASQYASSGYRMENASNEMWQNYYSMLANSKLIDSLVAKDPNKANMTNILAMNKAIRAYKTLDVTESFGDIPYTEAGFAIYGTSHYKPKYDKQEDIYKSCLADLKWAVDNLSTDAKQVSMGGAETLLNNDVAMWVKFANSLRLRTAINMYDKDATTAGPQIAEALTKPLLADGDNIGLWPSKIAGLVFSIHQWSLSANQYIRMGTTMWNQMSNGNSPDGSGIFDPRCKIFFEPNKAGNWVPYPQNPTTSTPPEGGDPYNPQRDNDWTNKGNCLFSPINYYFEDQVYIPELWITAAQVHFLQAEVYNRGLGVGKDPNKAKTQYEAGVTASCNFWNQLAMDCAKWVVGKPAGLPTATEMTALMSDPKVAYNTGDEAGSLKKIYTQYWIDGFRQAGEVWTLYRRTGGNLPKDPDNATYSENTYGIYHRYTYPTTEQDYNSANWHAAMGGVDTYGAKIWLEK